MKKPLLLLLLIGCILTGNAQTYKLVHYKNINKATQPAFTEIYLYKNGTFEYSILRDEVLLEVVESADLLEETKRAEKKEMLYNISLYTGTWVITGTTIVLKLENGKKKTLVKTMLDQNIMRLQDKEAVYYLSK